MLLYLVKKKILLITKVITKFVRFYFWNFTKVSYKIKHKSITISPFLILLYPLFIHVILLLPKSTTYLTNQCAQSVFLLKRFFKL